MRRTSKPSEPRTFLPIALLFALGLASQGCASRALFPTASEIEQDRRRPDGVAIDPTSLPPEANDAVEVEAGLVSLRTPLGVERAIATVSELFQKVSLEDPDIESLFSRDALAVTSSSGSGQLPPAALFWQQRFRRLDYTRLAGETIFRESELEIYRADDTLATPPHPAIRLEALNPGDVVIRAPILTARVGTDRLFGDEIVFWLRREGDIYKIYRVLEDFQFN